MWYLAALVALALLSLVVYFARREGKQSARLEALKREVKDRANAQAIIDNVRNMSADSVRDKLQQTK